MCANSMEQGNLPGKRKTRISERTCVQNTCCKEYLKVSSEISQRSKAVAVDKPSFNVEHFYWLRSFKGVSHKIFKPVFWPVCMHLGLNLNRFWFLSFNDAPLILDDYFKFWWVSGQIFPEILRILKKDWQLSLDSPMEVLWEMLLWGKWFSEILRISRKDWNWVLSSREGLATESVILQEYSSTILAWWIQLPFLLQDSKNLWEALAGKASKLKIVV